MEKLSSGDIEVRLFLHKENSPRIYTFDNHKQALDFYQAVWLFSEEKQTVVNL